MTIVNIHGIKPPQHRHDAQAIPQQQALVADALFAVDGHAAPPPVWFSPPAPWPRLWATL